MQIKMLTDHADSKANDIVDCDEITAGELIAAGKAEKNSQSEVEVKAVIDSMIDKHINIHVSGKEKKMETKNVEFAIGKMFQRIAGKTITGNSETGSAADGGNLVFTGLAELAPLVIQNSVVYSKCRKIPVMKNANAMKVPIDASDYVIAANAPVASASVAEGVAGSATKIVTGARTLTLAKTTIPIAVTEELLEDNAAVDAWVRASMVGKLANVLDYDVLVGASGYTGVIGDTGYTVTQSISATPTLAEVQAVTSKVHPLLSPEWYMSITLWNLMVGTFGTAANIQNQLINISGKELLGKKVNVMPCLSATQLVFGDFSQYTVLESPLGDRIAVSDQVRFLEGEVVFKMTHRGAGAVTFAARPTADSLSVGAFAQKA